MASNFINSSMATEQTSNAEEEGATRRCWKESTGTVSGDGGHAFVPFKIKDELTSSTFKDTCQYCAHQIRQRIISSGYSYNIDLQICLHFCDEIGAAEL